MEVDWHLLDVDVVVETSGHCQTRDDLQAHLDRDGVRKVVLAGPGRDLDATIVAGVNDDAYVAAEHHLVSAGSDTTVAAAPMLAVLQRCFGVREALLTAVHSYTGDQPPHPDPDLRRGRSAATSIVPATTEPARGLDVVLPELAGRVGGVTVHVPVGDVSLLDLTVRLDGPVTVGRQVNRSFRTTAEGPFKCVMRCSGEPLVSRDLLGDPASCVIDAGLTTATARLVKVFGWHDPECGYAQRVVDLVEAVARTLPA